MAFKSTAQIIADGGGRMPLKLKRLIAAHGITQSELGAAIIQEGGPARGRGLSKAAINLLINWGEWPRLTAAGVLKSQIEKFLRERGITDDEIAAAWDVDENGHRVYMPVRPNKKPRVQGGAAPESQYQFINQLPENEMLSQAARQHFKIFKDPFIDDVQSAADVFMSTETRYVREAMFATAKHGGIIAVIGESGAGKTVLRRDMIDRIQREGLPISVIQPRIIDKARLTAGSICDAIIKDISQESTGGSLEAKARKIERLLTGSSRAGNAHVLIIEEAHDLHVHTLKYLKRFWEIEDGFRKLIAIILIGQPELKAKLDERQNWDAREFIRRCEIAELMPLNGDLENYLELKFKRVGKDIHDIFAKDAFDAIRQRLTLRRRGSDDAISMHYPLVVNNTIIKCLNMACEIGAAKVNADVVMGV